jgi:hypothetical protein
MAHEDSPSENEGQFLYCGRWVDKKNFRAFVYGKDISTVANSYEDYLALIATGLWFDKPLKDEVTNNGTSKSDGKAVRKRRVSTNKRA